MLVTGLGWVAVLPPWEGFDEDAHFSYIQQLADDGSIPRLGSSFLSRDVEQYRSRLPAPYASVPPFDRNGGVTYHDFFSRVARPGAPPSMKTARRFEPGSGVNWEAQHPPLYYVLMSPMYAASRTWTLPAQLLLLRTASWLLACAGLALSVRAIARHMGSQPAYRLVPPLAAAWPFLVPMFFAEMARIGNDSLCLLLAGALWAMLLGVAARPPRGRDYAAIGGLLGLGLLTKALFVPITAAVVAWLALRRAWQGLAVVVVFAGVLGAPWYVHNWLTYGVASGSQEHIQLAEKGGMLAGLERNYSVLAPLRGIAGVGASFVWAGTWSLARFPEVDRLPLVALAVALLIGYAQRLRRSPFRDPVWLPALLAGSVFLGLAHHVLVRVALDGQGVGTPGWYLHVLAGPLAFAFALGAMTLMRRPAARTAVFFCSAYAIAYLAAVSIAQLEMYAGCVAKGVDKYYSLPSGWACVWDVGRLYRNLAVLGYPALGMPLLAAGIAGAGVLMYRLWRAVWQEAVAVRT